MAAVPTRSDFLVNLYRMRSGAAALVREAETKDDRKETTHCKKLVRQVDKMIRDVGGEPVGVGPKA